MIFDGQPQQITVDGHRRLVAARFGDPKSEKVLLFDPGSFGIYADGFHLCSILAERGWFTVATTRAGMFGSDPVPEDQAPRPSFHVADIARLLNTLGISRKVILAGHSMSGVRLHLAGALIPERIRGLVPIDAVCPSLMTGLTWASWVAWARGVGQAGAHVVSTSLSGLVDTLHPNTLQLDGRARSDKLASIASQEHLRAAAAEVAATEKRALDDTIDPALDLPAFFATATPVSKGTSKLLSLYAEHGTWAERIHCPKDGHMSILRPPSVLQIVDGIESLFEVSEDRFEGLG